MIVHCRNAGLPEPEFTLTDGFVTTIRRKPDRAFEAVGGETRTGTGPVTPPVTPPVETLLRLLGQAGDLGNAAIRQKLGLRDRTHLREHYLNPALADGVIEYTLPGKPKSRLQTYRLTHKGRTLLAEFRKGKKNA